MLKIKTRFISVVMTVAVAVTAVCGGAMSVSAATIEDRAKPYTSKVEGNLTPRYDDNTYSFNVSAKMNVAVHLLSEADTTYYSLINSRGVEIKPLNKSIISGSHDSRYSKIYWNNIIGRAEVNLQFKNLAPDTYYFLADKADHTYDGQYFELTITQQQPAPPPVQPLFTAGSTAPNVTATQSASAISVNWGAVPSARYAVYYVCQNRATGVFSDWTVKAVDTNSYSIPNPAKGVTYYITILPYGDNPRTYGGFSPYAQVRT